MYRIYYNAETGAITRIMSQAAAPESLPGPYKDIPNLIKINAWRIDTATGDLISQTPPPTRTR